MKFEFELRLCLRLVSYILFTAGCGRLTSNVKFSHSIMNGSITTSDALHQKIHVADPN